MSWVGRYVSVCQYSKSAPCCQVCLPGEFILLRCEYLTNICKSLILEQITFIRGQRVLDRVKKESCVRGYAAGGYSPIMGLLSLRLSFKESMMRKTNFFTVKLPDADLARLESLAKETDRSKGAVVRQLLKLADIPEARQLLGTQQSETNLTQVTAR